MKKGTHMKGMVFKGNDEPVVNMNKTLSKLKVDGGKRAKSSPFQKEYPKVKTDSQGRPISTKEDKPLTTQQRHDISAEKLNTTGKWCITCGTHEDEHSGKDHAFKVHTPPGPDTKKR